MSTPHSLPTPLTTFVGRVTELAALTDALCSARLVTVVGPGGCGKTRLAVAAAGRAVDRWSDGVRWVDLAATGDPGVVPELVAGALGLLLADDAVPSLARQIDDQRILVCLDNCEHVLAVAAEVVVALVRTCPHVTVLATSREPLGVPGELVWRVPSLGGDDAVALFVERSAQVAESAEARGAVRTACARLDGIPLAIELAAGWSGTLSAQEILRGLDDRFALLIRGPRGVAARHQTLAASMAWSHDLLDDADRVLLRRLGVFRGGCTLDTAVGVAAFDGLDRMAVLGGLRRLVDKSLVNADTTGTTTRYRMLETVREYAAARLAASDETDLVGDRHLATFLAHTEAAAPLLDTDKDAWRAVIGADHENLRAALDRGLSAADPEPGRRLAAGLPWLWHLGRHGHEGLTLLRRAIDRAPDDRTELQARLLTGLALVADTTQPVGLEYDAAQAALAIATEVGDTRSACLARLLSAVGLFYRDFTEGAALARSARDQAEQAEDGFVVDGATALLGIIHHLRDEHDDAEPLLRAAIDGLTRRGDRGVASTTLGFLAYGALYAGEIEQARGLATAGVRAARPLADYHRLGSATSVLATVEITSGRVAAANAVLEPMIRLVEGADVPPFVPGLARAMGHLHLHAGHPGEAIAWFRRHSTGSDGDLDPETLTGLAAALRTDGATDAAAAACELALTEARRLGMPRVVADALAQSARLAEPTHPARAEDLHHQALAIQADRGLWLHCVDSLEALAALAARSESYVEATRLLAACHRARQHSDRPRPTPPPDLRTALGDDAYDTAWTEGQAMNLRDAIDYTRRARGRRGRPASGWASLTPTERSVVRLAADGLSNPDIGSRLFMSRGTVKTHLSHVYAKLGVTNRTELAAMATAHLDR
jgi:predicted ATPase/DNA-binding CsgD family transcriptional regulator